MPEEAKECQKETKRETENLVQTWEVGGETHFIYFSLKNVSFITVQVPG